MQYIRRSITNEGNPKDPEIVELVRILKPICKRQQCSINIEKWFELENYTLKSKVEMWAMVNVTSLMKELNLGWDIINSHIGKCILKK
jgi:hypothetical protein